MAGMAMRCGACGSPQVIEWGSSYSGGRRCIDCGVVDEWMPASDAIARLKQFNHPEGWSNCGFTRRATPLHRTSWQFGRRSSSAKEAQARRLDRENQSLDAKGHAYALVRENDRMRKELESLRALSEQHRIRAIKAEREGGNLYAALERLQDGPYDEQTAEMFALMQEMNEQECEIVLMVARKLVGEGKEEHGPMQLQDDDRDLLGEALDEVTDGLTYVLMRLLKGRL